MFNRWKIFSVLFAVACALLIGQAAHAQDSPFAIENVPNIVGVGAGILPDYEGSNNYTIGAAPFFRLTYPKSNFFATLIATELYVNVMDHPWLRFGPVVNYRFGRNNVDDKVVKHMEDIDGAFEAGAFAGVEFIDSQNPRQRFIATVEILSDISNVYKGYNMSASARYWYPVHKMVDVTLGVGAAYADDNYMKTYFGVNQKDSDRTGLPVFEADSGIKDVRVVPGVVVHLSPDWHVGAGFRYAKLLNDAKDSPVVKDRGSSDQWIAGLAVGYSW